MVPKLNFFNFFPIRGQSDQISPDQWPRVPINVTLDCTAFMKGARDTVCSPKKTRALRARVARGMYFFFARATEVYPCIEIFFWFVPEPFYFWLTEIIIFFLTGDVPIFRDEFDFGHFPGFSTFFQETLIPPENLEKKNLRNFFT